MGGPELDMDEDDDDGGIADFDGEETASDDGPDGIEGVGEVDLGLGDEDGIVDGFDGTDDADGSSSSSSGSGGGSSESTDQDIAISSAIENGMAEVACVGLRGHERQRVRSEMQAVAEKFKVGYFGEKCAKKYLDRDIENIPPEYGLAAAMIAFAAITLHKRPDGEYKVKRAVRTLRERFTGGGSRSSSSATAETNADADTEEDSDE